jgi:hypothetical protein
MIGSNAMSLRERLFANRFIGVIAGNLGIILFLFGIVLLTVLYPRLAESVQGDLRNLKLIEEEVGKSNFLIIGREIRSNGNVDPQDIAFYLNFASLHWRECAKEFGSNRLPAPETVSEKFERKFVWPN